MSLGSVDMTRLPKTAFSGRELTKRARHAFDSRGRAERLLDDDPITVAVREDCEHRVYALEDVGNLELTFVESRKRA